jgi:hypothetical protein
VAAATAATNVMTDFGKKSSPLHRGKFQSLFRFFALVFFTLTRASIFVFFKFFLLKVSKVKENGCKLNFGLRKW